MKRRLYFLLPDVMSTRRTVNDLLLARVEDRHMHVLARRGTDLGDMHEASALQKSDFVHGAQVGALVGALGGVAIGLFMVMTPPEGIVMHPVTMLITGLLGALFGTWAASLIGASVPNTRLGDFYPEIEAGRVLLMIDVPASRVDEIRELVHRRHPEATGGRVETAMPAFP